MSRETKPQPEMKRRRPGRFRRWLVRPFFWTLTMIVVLAFGLWLTLHSSRFQDRVRREIVTRLSDRLDRAVQIGDLRFRLIPLSVDLSNVSIADSDPSEPPCFTVEELSVSADVFWRKTWRLDLRSLEARHPVLRLRLLDDGGTNLPSFRRDQTPSGARVDVRIGSLTLQQGEFDYEDRQLPFDLKARDVRASLFGDQGLVVQGETAAEEVRLTLPGGSPYLGSVTARTRLDTGRLEILSSRVHGPHLQATARGAVTWGERRRASIQVQVMADGELLDDLGYLKEQIRGQFEIHGNVLWEPDSWGVRGKLSSPSATVFGWPMTDLRGAVAVDRNATHIDVEQARFGGGLVEGSFSIDTQQDGSPSELDLQMSDLAVEPLLMGLSIPLENLRGKASGQLVYRFPLVTPESGSGWANLTVEALQPQSGSVSLSGSVPVIIEGGEVRIGALRLESPAHRVTGSGIYRLTDESGAFDFQIESSQIGRLRYLLPFDTDTEPPLWLPRSGQGRLDAHLDFTPDVFSVHLGLDLTDVAAPGLVADRATGSLDLMPLGVTQMRLDLARPDGALLVTGSVPFEEGPQPPDAPPLRVQLESANWPVADATPWLPTELPLDGSFTGTIRLGGTLDQLSGDLSGRVDPMTIAGIRSGALTADLTFDPERLTVQEASWAMPSGEITGRGTMRFEDDELSFDLDSTGLDVQQEPLDQIGLPGVAGSLRFSARVAGTLESPDVRAEIDGSALTVADQEAPASGETRVTVNWAEGQLQLQGSLLGLVEIDGGGALTESSADLQFRFHGDDLERLLASLGTSLPATLEGAYDGTIVVRQAEGDQSPNVLLTVDRLTARYEGETLESLEPVRVRLASDALEVESLYLGAKDGTSELFLGGRIGFGDPGDLNLHIQGTLAAHWLKLFVPGVAAQGAVDVLATIRGTIQEPRFNGEAELRDGSLIVTGFPHSLDDIQGLALLYPEQIVLDHLTGRIAAGTVRVAGSARRDPSQPFGIGYRLQIDAKGLELRYPEDWRVRAGAQLVFSSTPEGRMLRGVVNVDRALYVKDVRVGPIQLLQDFLRRNPQRLAETDETLRSTQLQVQVEGQQALRVRNNLGDVTGDIDLVVRGSLARPILFGRVVVNSGSTLTYAGNEYEVVRGELNFANPYRIDPYIDLVAEATIREYDVTLNLSGSLERPNATFSSNPPLADLDVLALVATGRTTGTQATTLGAPAGSGGAAEGFLYGQAAGLVAERANSLFGLDTFQIDPLSGNSGNLSSARVTVGKRLSKDVLATYSYDPSTTEVQILQVEWRINRGLALILTQNGDNTYAVDAKWEKRF